ncbi:hypothetical protein ACXWOF_09495, partial [Streptococcus pyogenes]
MIAPTYDHPEEFITINITGGAVTEWNTDDDGVSFVASFDGIRREVSIPWNAMHTVFSIGGEGQWFAAVSVACNFSSIQPI